MRNYKRHIKSLHDRSSRKRSHIKKVYNIIFTIPTKFLIEKQILMKVLGAKIIDTPREDGILGAVKKAEELLNNIENSISLIQLKNQANSLAYYETTDPEIYEAMEGKIDYSVCGAGTGGIFTGVAKYIKEKTIKAILADPKGPTMG